MALGGLRGRWVAWRNQRLADPAFQRWAATFPLTRSVARRRAESLFDLVAGFVYSQTLSACVRLDLFERLKSGPKSVQTLASELQLTADSTERLLGAGAALGLVEHAGEARYALGPQGAALLGNPGLSQMIEHHRHFYADLSDGVGLLRCSAGRGDLAAYWPYATSDKPRDSERDAVADYSALMVASLPPVAANLFAAYPIARHRRLMDVGGGEGAFLAEAGKVAPKLELTLFDLPAVAGRARERLGRAGLLDRTTIVSGDFLADPIPMGADLITLIRILHDHDDAGVATLLKSLRGALPDDGALLIVEPMSGAPKADRVADVYFAFYLLAMGRGRARAPAEIMGMLHEAGFRRTRLLSTPTPYLQRAILARP